MVIFRTGRFHYLLIILFVARAVALTILKKKGNVRYNLITTVQYKIQNLFVQVYISGMCLLL